MSDRRLRRNPTPGSRMTGTVLLFRDDGDQPLAQILLGNGDRVQLALKSDGLVVTRLGPPGPVVQPLFRASTETVARICAGLVGPKRQSDVSPLRLLTAIVQAIESAQEVRAAFIEAAASID